MRGDAEIAWLAAEKAYCSYDDDSYSLTETCKEAVEEWT